MEEKNIILKGAKIAEYTLENLGYPQDKIEKVKHCIYAHRGSQNIKPESLEANLLIQADAMSNFDNIAGIIKAAIVYEGKTQAEAKKHVFEKLTNKWNQLSDYAKELVEEKYNAVKVLFG